MLFPQSQGRHSAPEFCQNCSNVVTSLTTRNPCVFEPFRTELAPRLLPRKDDADVETDPDREMMAMQITITIVIYAPAVRFMKPPVKLVHFLAVRKLLLGNTCRHPRESMRTRNKVFHIYPHFAPPFGRVIFLES